MAEDSKSRTGLSLGPLQYAIIVLVVITAVIHLNRGFGMQSGPPPGARGNFEGARPPFSGTLQAGAPGSFARPPAGQQAGGNAQGGAGATAGAAAGGFQGRGEGGFQGGPPGGQRLGFQIVRATGLSLGQLFILNGIGYLVLLLGLYLPALARYRRPIRWVLILYTALTIFMYFAIVGARQNQTGWITKAVEVAIIVLLVIEDWQSRKPPAAAPA
jgi:hypothetical protein